jgi:hypothetical protein
MVAVARATTQGFATDARLMSTTQTSDDVTADAELAQAVAHLAAR